MTRLSCPSCRMRFDLAATTLLTTCPECGRPLEAAGSAAETMGLRLFAPTDPQPTLPMAGEAALPPDGPWPDRV
jgi:predicted amidophosphoribosyltransferase